MKAGDNTCWLTPSTLCLMLDHSLLGQMEPITPLQPFLQSTDCLHWQMHNGWRQHKLVWTSILQDVCAQSFHLHRPWLLLSEISCAPAQLCWGGQALWARTHQLRRGLQLHLGLSKWKVSLSMKLKMVSKTYTLSCHVRHHRLESLCRYGCPIDPSLAASLPKQSLSALCSLVYHRSVPWMAQPNLGPTFASRPFLLRCLAAFLSTQIRPKFHLGRASSSSSGM